MDREGAHVIGLGDVVERLLAQDRVGSDPERRGVVGHPLVDDVL
jgi:hypothetical protein